MHASFVRSLGQLSYVKAIGFKDLAGSRDVFKLMGMHGEMPINFADLPVENSFFFPGLDSKLLCREIKIALMRNNFYDKILAQKL